MRAVLGVSFAVLAAGDQVISQPAQPAQPAQAAPDVTMGQAELANQMGAYYRSIYAPGVPAMAPGAAPQAQPAGMGGMGGFGSAYGPMGTQVGQAYDGAFGGSAGQVQASQNQLANQLGGFYRSQYVTPQVEAQVRAQQAAQAQQAAEAAKSSKSAKDSKAPEVLVAAEPAAPTPAPVPQNAADCTSMDELKEWFKARSSTVKKYVPKDYQTYAMKSIESDFDTNKKRLEGGSKAPGDTVKGPLMLDDTDKESDSMFDQFKQKVSEDTKEVEKTAGSWIDEVSQGLKSSINSAANAVEGKADKAADEVKKDVKDKDEKKKKDASPEKLLAEEKGSSPVMFLLPCLGLGVAAGVYLKRRASDDDELAPVYHMQV